MNVALPRRLRELALFAGAGGGILGGHILGWRTVCAVEWAEYPRRVLLARQQDGCLPRFPIWDDVTTFDGKPWNGHVDVVSGGFPCQDISVAGKGDGLDGERSGLWREMARIIGEVRPRYAFVENSPALTFRGLDRVLGDFTEMGFNCRWGVISAADVGAPHLRERIWIVATDRSVESQRSSQSLAGNGEASDATDSTTDSGNSRRAEPAQFYGGFWTTDGGNDMANARRKHGRPRDATRVDSEASLGRPSPVHNQPSGAGSGEVCHTSGEGLSNGPREPMGQPVALAQPQQSDSEVPDTERTGLEGLGAHSGEQGFTEPWDDCIPLTADSWWKAESDVGRVAHGVASRVDRLKAIGNGQVSLVAAYSFSLLSGMADVPENDATEAVE